MNILRMVHFFLANLRCAFKGLHANPLNLLNLQPIFDC